ncbi:MmgE/PrpD family protein [Chloroflexota bacterium]
MNVSVSRRLARFTCDLGYDDLPPGIVEKIKVLLLHGIGVGLAGYDTETAQVAIDVAKKQGPGRATLMIDGSKVTANMAAFANGTLLHSRAEEDDFQEGSIHPGVVLIPAALAISEIMGASGKELIVALAAGYEVSCRVSKDFCKLSTPRGFRSTPNYGVLGTAATAAKLLNLNEDNTVFSLGWGANLASGMIQCAISKTPEMPIQAGLASQNGMLAAQLGESGVLAAEDMLEGEKGFYYAICGTNAGMEKITEGLGKEYKMVDVFQKRHPVGGSQQTPVSAMLDLVKEHNILPENIESVELILPQRYSVYPGTNSLEPGLISAQYCLAVACFHRKMTLTTLADLDNKAVRELMVKIIVKGDESVSPPASKLSITLKDKRVLVKDMPLTYQDYCFSFDEERKYIEESLVPEMSIPEERWPRIAKLIANVESWRSVDELMELLTCPGRIGKRIRIPF